MSQPTDYAKAEGITELSVRSSAMAFHETFWLVTGTAAPVLGLAAVLSIGDVTRLISVHRDWLGRQVMALIENTPRPPARPNLLIPELENRLRWLQRAQMFLVRTAIAQVANVALQTVLLAVSLLAIMSQANEGPPLLWLAVAALGMAILAVAGIVSTFVRVGQDLFDRRIAMVL